MKGEDLQKLVLYKYEKGEPSTKIFEDLNDFVSFRTIRRWCKRVRETDTINLFHSLGRPRIIRTKGMIQKVRKRMKRKKRVSVRKLAGEQRVCCQNLETRPRISFIQEKSSTSSHRF